MKIPTGLVDNLLYRDDVYASAEKSKSVRRGCVAECAASIHFYVNTFVWQYNPQHRGEEVGPFITWDFQDEAFKEILSAIEEGRDLVIEKSREMGASWMCLLAMEWLWHFHPNKKFLLVSRSADAVDSEDADSLFWKLDFVHRHQPQWLLPKKWRRRAMFYGNDALGSAITGQASTGKAGIGGRATAIFVDEFSQIREATEVLHRTADTSRCRIFNFTHTGIETAAYKLAQRPDVKKLRLHWSQHPEKNKGLYQYDRAEKRTVVFDKQYFHGVDFDFVEDGKLRSPWYDNECRRRASSRAVAMDLDIDPRGAMSQFFDSEVLDDLIRTYCCAPYWQGDLEFDQDTGTPLGAVKRGNGYLKLWLHLDAKGQAPRGKYAIGCDPALGMGATKSCVAVVNDLGEKVAEYGNPWIKPDELGAFLVALAWFFKDENGDGGTLIWECPGAGIAVAKYAMELGYRNVYYRTSEKGSPWNKPDNKSPGWHNTNDGFLTLFQDYHSALVTHQFVNRSEGALNECKNFRFNSKGVLEHALVASEDDPTGAKVNHGDQAVADALAWKVMRTSVRKREKAEEPSEMQPGSLAWRRLFSENRQKSTW